VSTSRFAGKVASNTFFSIIDVLLLKVSTVLAFVLLVRLLPTEDIAAVGVATGYLVFIQYLDVAPIRVLLRDYPKLAADRVKRDELLTVLFVFWGLQAFAMALVSICIVTWVLAPLKIAGIGYLYAAMVLDFLAMTLHGWIKVVYFADFQQRIATTLSVVLSAARLASYVGLFLFPSLETFSTILAVFAVVSSAVWLYAFQRRFQFRPVWHKESPKVLVRSLSDYGLWDHFNRVVIDTLFIVDLVILSWFAGVRDMSSYTVALKFASLLRIVPAQLNSALQISVAKLVEQTKRVSLINTLFKVNLFVSIAQFLVIVVFGQWLMTILFGQEPALASISLAIILSAAVSIFNVAYPLIGIINNFCSIRVAFLTVFLPTLILGILVYLLGSASFGATGMAWANVVAYSSLAIGLVIFVKRQHPVPIVWKLVTEEERMVLGKFIDGMRQRSVR
jgi:O-antigen/teichoic acid export membrane protein